MRKECIKAKELMTLLVDNKIDAGDMVWFNKHILSCNNCAEEFEEIKKIKNVLKTLKQENVPPDFYFKLNKALDKTEEKGKNNILFSNFQVAFRLGVIFTVFIFGFVVTMKIVKDNRKFISPDFMEIEQKSGISEIKKTDDIIIKKEADLVTVRPKQKDFVEKKVIEMPVSVVKDPVKIEYKKPRVPYNLVSAGAEGIDYSKAVNRVYMQPIPAKSYYELDQKQIQDEFDLRVQNFVIDNHDTWEKFRLKYDIDKFGKTDFATEMMLLITVDDGTSGNYSVEIVNALKEINKIIVYYRINRISKADTTIVQPQKYDVKIISKTQLPVIFKRIQ